MIELITKTEDRKFRIKLLYLAESAWKAYIKTGSEVSKEQALYFGGESKKMAEKIKNHDYTQDELKRKRIDNIIYVKSK